MRNIFEEQCLFTMPSILFLLLFEPKRIKKKVSPESREVVVSSEKNIFFQNSITNLDGRIGNIY